MMDRGGDLHKWFKDWLVLLNVFQKLVVAVLGHRFASWLERDSNEVAENNPAHHTQ